MRFLLPLLLTTLLFACGSNSKNHNEFLLEHSIIICDDHGCRGQYKGPEFKDGSDIAHQFSNLMADSVGAKLKSLYALKRYSEVDFQNIEMFTYGMGTGAVDYQIEIPFRHLTDSCLAFTSFDHCGGWGQKPDLEQRKKELSDALLPKDDLFISNLKTTPEGLQEYWIQWRHKKVQSHCK